MALIFLFITIIVFSLPITSASAFQKTTISGLGAMHKVRALLIMPDGPGPFPGVLILHTSGGLKSYDIDFAQRLAQEGYACLIPYYMKAYGLTYDDKILVITTHADDILADFTAEIEYLKKLPKVNNSKIGTVGFSLGGYWALILAAMHKVQAGVSYYGAMNGRWKNFSARYLFDDVFNANSSPVLILHGKDDAQINVKDALDLGETLKEKKCIYELHIYPNAGHRFDRGKAFVADAADDSWRRTLGFLKKYLK